MTSARRGRLKTEVKTKIRQDLQIKCLLLHNDTVKIRVEQNFAMFNYTLLRFLNVILVPCTRVLLSFSFHLYKFCTFPWYQTLYVKLCIVAQCVFLAWIMWNNWMRSVINRYMPVGTGTSLYIVCYSRKCFLKRW